MRTPIRSAIATVAATALAVTGLALGASANTDPAPTQSDDFVLNASDMEPGSFEENLPVGDFTVTAAPGSNVQVTAHARTGAGGHEFTQRLELRGGGSAQARSVHFEVAEESTLIVHALSGSASADRTLALHRLDGAGDAVVAQVPAYGDPGAQIPAAAVVVPDAGSYYLASTGSGINVYRMQVLEGELPERLPWAEVADPVITDVGPDTDDPTHLVISFDGEVGIDGADVATARLSEAGGTVVAQEMSATEGASGQIALTPPASGTFTAEVVLSRDGEEDKVSEPVTAPEFVLPLGTAQVHSALTTDITDGLATVTVEWAPVAEAEHYDVAYRASGETDFTETSAGLTEPEAEIPGLTPGAAYEVQVRTVRGDDSTVSDPYEVTVADVVERWLTAHAGVGSGGEAIVAEDGSVFFDAIGNNGKIADSEDGFWYHYTEVDPATENFTLSVTFTVEAAEGKDNQSGFGIIAIDDFVPNNPSARYFNSAGTMAAKYNDIVGGSVQSRYGLSGGKFVTGYTDGPSVASADRDMTASEPFDWDFREAMTEGSNVNPPKFITGDTFEYTLRYSNTGFHASATFVGNPETDEPAQEYEEIIYYDRDLVLTQSEDSFYVGVFGTRGIQVRASDIELTTIHPDDDEDPLERPIEYITPSLNVDGTRTTPHHQVAVPVTANVAGEVVITDAAGAPVTEVTEVAPGQREILELDLAAGVNDFVAHLTPAAEQPQLAEYEELSSYDRLDVDLRFTVASYGEPGQAIHVAPNGSAQGTGSPADPLDIHTAVGFAQPGQQIVLAEGTYTPDRAIVIDRGNNGTAGAPITLMSQPGARAVLDLSESPSGGINLRGDHWHLYNLEITGSQGYQKPLLISGHHNVIERIESHHNGDTGVQISGSSVESPQLWPSHNLVLSSVSHNNVDPLANDADGFAAKLTVGEGNVFRYNIAYHNIDDGWDLYARSTTGSIGVVTIEDSVTFNNGWLENDDEIALVGEGNGFKLGGESMPGAHVLRNSISYNNLAKGITSNSGPDPRVADVTSYYNGHVVDSLGRMNVQLTTNTASQTDFEATGVLSYRGQQVDDIVLVNQEDTLRPDPSNYFDGRNVDGTAVDESWFVSLDFDAVRPQIAADGSIDMGGLLELTDAAPADTGARLGPNPDPTVIELLPPVGEDDGGIPVEQVRELRSRTQSYVDEGQIAGPIAHQLTNALDQALRHLEADRTNPATSALDRFVRHLENPKRPDTLTEQAQSDLLERVGAVLAELE
ncbi:FIMAH domain-containing protein [Pseudactinotalea sp. Z1739]|uniref:FIMAH domain-containing protein n=1 Tax=Pseudactinotalea sp. Z1739 TaxID=3413028 RepID=UPI003C7A8E03